MHSPSSPKSRDFWKEHGKEHGHEATAELMYEHTPGLVEGTPDDVVEFLKKKPEFVNRFPMVDVMAFALYEMSWAPTWKVVEELGGIDEANFYYMFNVSHTKTEFGIPWKETQLSEVYMEEA